MEPVLIVSSNHASGIEVNGTSVLRSEFAGPSKRPRLQKLLSECRALKFESSEVLHP